MRKHVTNREIGSQATSVVEHWRLVLEKRFLVRVKKTKTCWVWTGSKIPAGYGRFSTLYREFYAHRASYEIFVGPIPKGHSVCHRCDKPFCVRPDHLFTGTAKENAADKVSKNRHIFGEVHYLSKITEEIVRELRKDHALGVLNQNEAGRRLGMSPSSINAIVHRRNWKHVE